MYDFLKNDMGLSMKKYIIRWSLCRTNWRFNAFSCYNECRYKEGSLYKFRPYHHNNPRYRDRQVWTFSKQCKPWSDWSGSILIAIPSDLKTQYCNVNPNYVLHFSWLFSVSQLLEFIWFISSLYQNKILGKPFKHKQDLSQGQDSSPDSALPMT